MDKPWKAIKMPMYKWYKLHERINQDYPNVFLFRHRLRNTLGFTTREQHYMDANRKNYEHRMCLDFFSEPKRTMFLLKYGEYLEK